MKKKLIDEILKKQPTKDREETSVVQKDVSKVPSKGSLKTSDEKKSQEIDGEKVSESLEVIYEGQPSKEWLNTLDRGRRKTWVVVLSTIAILSAFVAVIAWVGFWFWGGSGFSGKGIEIQIEGPDQVSIGQEVSYYVNWFNISREPLASTEFRVSFPNDFIVTSVDPEPTSVPLVFRLGAQSIEGRGTMKITGVFTGSLGTKSAIQVITTYRPASFNSNFEGLQSKDIEYTQSILKGSLDVPTNIVPGEEIVLKYTVSNSGSRTMENLRARFHLPEGFAPTASTTQGGLDDRMIESDLGTLEGGVSKTVELYGTFAARSGGEFPLVAEAGFVLGDGTFAPAQRSESTLSILAGDLDLMLVVNGSQEDRSADLGEWQRLAISYENLSGKDLGNVEIALYLEPSYPEGVAHENKYIDWEKLDDPLKGIQEGDAIRFDKGQIEELKRLLPESKGVIEVSVPLLSALAPTDDVPLTFYVEAKIQDVAGSRVDRVIKTKPITLHVRSDAKIDGVARYTSEEGAPLGAGPLPPVVGSSTTYRVEWHIAKTLHVLDKIVVTATLPSSASWSGEREVGAGEIVCDQDKKLITWTINKMPQDVNELFVSFDVSIRPAEADFGRFAQIMSETRFEFLDSTLNESVLRTSPALTTDLPDDALAKRKGVVAKP